MLVVSVARETGFNRHTSITAYSQFSIPRLRFRLGSSTGIIFLSGFPILFPSLTGLSKSESLVSRFWLMRQPAFEEA